MKKNLSLIFILILTTTVSFAQQGYGDRFRKQRATQSLRGGQITGLERLELIKDWVRQSMIQRHARRDGVVTPFEKVRINKAKCNTRRDAIRFKHYGSRRLI